MAIASRNPAPRKSSAGGGNATRVLGYVGLLLLTSVFAIPILWMALSAFKTNAESTSIDPVWIPSFTLEGFRTITDNPETPAVRWFINSVLAASIVTVLTVVTASLAAYALARMNFRFKNAIFAVIISTLFIPGVILTIPLFIVVDQLQWIDTIWAVAVPGAAGAFGVFFLRQFFSSLPKELEEAAFVDGANRWEIFTRVILPLSRPALVTLALISFLANWNDFLWPVYALLNADNQTLPPGLATLQNANSTDYAVLMAGAMIASVPVIILFIFFQRYIIEGVSRSGLKG
jgi:multiple sugar transport system permease protein